MPRSRLSTFKTRERCGLRMPGRRPSDAVTPKHLDDARDHVERLLDARDRMWSKTVVDLRRSVEKLQRAVGRSMVQTVAEQIVALRSEHDAQVSALKSEVSVLKGQVAEQSSAIIKMAGVTR